LPSNHQPTPSPPGEGKEGREMKRDEIREQAAILVKPLIDAGRIEDAIRIYEEAVADEGGKR
jgi:hypothetical protein